MTTPLVRTLAAELPDDLAHLVFVTYRVGLRRRMAQRRLQTSRKCRVLRELTRLFDLSNGWPFVVLALVRPASDVLTETRAESRAGSG